MPVCRSSLLLALTLVACGAGQITVAEDGSIEQARDYVRTLADDCVYDDGYRCQPGDGGRFESVLSEQRMVPASYLRVWPQAYAAFLKLEELSDEQKQLRHYKIGFDEDEQHIIVLFRGLLLPLIEHGEASGVMRASFGLSTQIWVDKNSLKVMQYKFLR